MTDGGELEDIEKAAVPRTPDAARRFAKTPFFVANSALRYHRQQLIKDIESLTSRKLLCYICGNDAEIHRDDTAGFVDMLHNVHAGEKIDLVLHTGGGDIDVAEKLIKLAQARVGADGDIRAVVPEYAKSAGTLMTLGCNSILMSDTSELGAIDPQIVLNDGLGNQFSHSVFHYLAVYRRYEDALRKTPGDPVARMMFDKFDPAVVQKFQVISDRARVVAENLLKRQGMPFSKITASLLNVEVWKSHNQMISAQDAREIGLTIEFVGQDEPLWEKIWQLHCLQRLATEDKQTLFESYYVSLAM